LFTQPSSYVVHFKCALNFGEAQAKRDLSD
jgi:hypothetical protein